MSKFYIEDRLRSFARMITGNYRLKVVFAGATASITKDLMYIPPLEDSQEAFLLGKFLVAHESGHDLFSDFKLKERTSKKSALLGDILNTLEDARIERLMTSLFEGLDGLFESQIQKIIAGNDYSKIPVSTQALHGLYMMGKGYDISPLCSRARDLIEGMEGMANAAAHAGNNRETLKIAEKIYEKLKHLEDAHKTASSASLAPGAKTSSGINLPDMVIDSLDKYKLEDDYDGMNDCIALKDENADEKATEDIPNKRSKQEYLPLIKNHSRHQSYLVQHLRNIVETKRRKSGRNTLQCMQTEGSVDVRRLWKIATGDDRILKRRENKRGLSRETDPDSLVVYILLDESHSMQTADRIQYSKEAAAVLGEVLHSLGIPFAVTGYSANSSLIRYLYKRFDEDYSEAKTRLVGATSRVGTFTQEHIPYALRRLESRKERKKVLIVVTDAEEIESEARFRRAVDMAKDDGVELVGLGINTNCAAKYFHRFVELTDLNRFGEELLRILKGVIQG